MNRKPTDIDLTLMNEAKGIEATKAFRKEWEQFKQNGDLFRDYEMSFAEGKMPIIKSSCVRRINDMQEFMRNMENGSYNATSMSKVAQQAFYQDYKKFADRYAGYLEDLAAMDQSGFNELAVGLDSVRKAGYALDCTNPENMKLDESHFNLYDIQTSPSLLQEKEGTLQNVYLSLMGKSKEEPWRYICDQHNLEKVNQSVNLITEKFNTAASTAGIEDRVSTTFAPFSERVLKSLLHHL